MGKWISTKKVAEKTGWNVYTIRHWCKKGLLQCRQSWTNPEKGRGKRGGHLFVAEDSIQEWMYKR